MPNDIDFAAFGRAMKSKRKDENLSLQNVTDLTGISKSTISRVESGKYSADFENFIKGCQWLNVPFGSFDTSHKVSVCIKTGQNTTEAVKNQLLKDETLTPENAEILGDIFDAA